MFANKNILITSAGRRVSLVNFFKKETKRMLGDTVKVFTTDLHPELSAACQMSDKSFKVGYFADEDYMDVLLDICKMYKIGMIIPTIDTELKLLSIHKNRFFKEGIHIIISDVDLITKCRDKRLTSDLFKELDIPVPAKMDPLSPVFPMFIKPIDGSSSKDLFVITHENQLNEEIVNTEKYVHMEYLDPNEYNEYTLDLYYNKESNLKCVVPRKRIEVRGGEVNKGITEMGILVEYIMLRMAYLKGAYGCITLQLFKHITDDSKILGIEINPRFGGGYPLSYLAGANFIEYLINEYYLSKQIMNFTNWKDQLLLLRYDTELVIDVKNR